MSIAKKVRVPIFSSSSIGNSSGNQPTNWQGLTLPGDFDIIVVMRVEPFTVGDFVHAFNRGNKRMSIFRDVNDKWRFLRILRFLNDEYLPNHPLRDVTNLARFDLARLNPLAGKSFEWPKYWPPHKPLVKILSYKERETHFHLLLKEIIPGGISKFMKRLGDAYTLFFNQKYQESGRVFQSSYKGRTPKGEIKNLHYLDAYVQVFNAFEDYPGGIEKSLKEFDKAFEFALKDPFCSLGESFGIRNFGIVDRDILAKTFAGLETYKKFVKDALLVRNIRETLGKLTLE